MLQLGDTTEPSKVWQVKKQEEVMATPANWQIKEPPPQETPPPKQEYTYYRNIVSMGPLSGVVRTEKSDGPPPEVLYVPIPMSIEAKYVGETEAPTLTPMPVFIFKLYSIDSDGDGRYLFDGIQGLK